MLQVITASGRQVKLADQEASNGVIHEVGGVLFPPPGTVTFAVSKCPVFTTLLKAVKIAGLAELLDGKWVLLCHFKPVYFMFTCINHTVNRQSTGVST